MRTSRLLLLAALCALAATAAPGSAQARNRWRVPDTAPDWAAPSARAADASNAGKMVFSVWLGWRNQAALQSSLQSLYDPSSATYQHWLTPQQFRAAYSPSDAQVATVRSWLAEQGFSVIDAPRNNLFVTASGSTAQVEQAFSVNIDLYHLDGHLVRAPDQDPSVPAGLAPDVRAITGLDGAMALTAPSHTPAATQPPPPPAGHSVGPCSRYWGQQTSTAYTNPYRPGAPLPWIPCGYTPSQITSAYHVDALHRLGITGRGQTIAITGAFFSPTIRDDANRFSREFRLPKLTRRNYSEVVAPGTLRYPRDDDETQSWYIEQALDVEWAHAVAPDARLVYVGAANDAAGLDHALNTTIDNHLANIISNSWGLPEAYASKSEITTENDMFKQAAAEGIGVYVASGDYGDLKDAIGRKSVGFPDSSPWVTSVGGTAIGIGDRGQSLWETGWGSTSSDWNGKAWKPDALGDFLGGSGGGVSHVFGQPWYQQGVVPSAAATWNGQLRRSEPDIAMDADPDTPVIFTQSYSKPDGKLTQIDSWIGGTSVSAPMTAALMALADQGDRHPHGFANPGLYRLAGTAAFNDIVPSDGTLAVLRNSAGENGGVLTHLRSIDHDSSLTTARGWDDVTGLGSPDAWWLSWLLR